MSSTLLLCKNWSLLASLPATLLRRATSTVHCHSLSCVRSVRGTPGFSLTPRLRPMISRFPVCQRVLLTIPCRHQTNSSCNEGAEHIECVLRQSFPTAASVSVEDISGGCGAMYAVHVEDAAFAAMNRVSQHRAVQDALRREIANMHGIRVSTSVPQS